MTIKVGVRLGAVVVTALLLSSVMMVGQMLFVHPSSQQLTGEYLRSTLVRFILGPITNAFLSPVTSSSSSYSSLPISGGVPSLAAFGLAASSILAVLGRMRKVGLL